MAWNEGVTGAITLLIVVITYSGDNPIYNWWWGPIRVITYCYPFCEAICRGYNFIYARINEECFFNCFLFKNKKPTRRTCLWWCLCELMTSRVYFEGETPRSDQQKCSLTLDVFFCFIWMGFNRNPENFEWVQYPTRMNQILFEVRPRCRKLTPQNNSHIALGNHWCFSCDLVCKVVIPS